MSKLKQNSIVYLFSRMWQYSKGNRAIVATFWSMFIVSGLISLVLEPYFVSRIMNIAQKEGITQASLPELVKNVVFSFLCALGFWMFHGPARVMEQDNSFILKLNYRKFFLNGIIHLPMPWHVGHHSGDTIDRVEKGTNSMYLFSENSFQIVYTIIKIVVCYGVLLYFSFLCGMIAIGFLILSFLITIKIDRILVGHYRKISRSENEVSKRIIDMFTNMATVIILRVERPIYDAVIRRVADQNQIAFVTNRLAEFKWFATCMCCAAMSACATIVFLYQNSRNNTPFMIGTLFLLMSYLRNICEVSERFTNFYSDMIKWKVRTDNAEELSVDFSNHDYDRDVLPSTWAEISIRDLSFAYPDTTGLQLDSVNLSLKRGSRVAFIGRSGGGKTTLLKLMRGLFNPVRAEIAVDGVVCEAGFNTFSESVALVPQNPDTFEATILENLTLGADYSPADIEKALSIAGFAEVVANLPKGLYSAINEKGVNLSGGQNQRLALARAILASFDKPVVLLDEPTSSLDPETEARVFDNLLAEFAGKLVVASVHRLHLLPRFDHIVVFDGGRIVAQGTLTELLTTSIHFQELWRANGGK